VKFGLRKGLRALRRRFGFSHQGSSDPVHFLVDWSNVACRKGRVDTSKIFTSRSPHDVTCPRCMKAKPSEFSPVDRAYARVRGAGITKRRDDVVEWIHAAGGPEEVLRMPSGKIREGAHAYLGG
jgi:hypothetical protein